MNGISTFDIHTSRQSVSMSWAESGVDRSDISQSGSCLTRWPRWSRSV